MSSTAPPVVTGPEPVQGTVLAPQTSLFSIERMVTLLAPFFAAAAAYVSGLVATNFPGLPKIDSTGLAGLMIAAFLGTVALVIKWLHGRQLPAIAALSPIKVTQHTLDTMYAEIYAYLKANPGTFQGPQGAPGVTAAEVQALVRDLLGGVNQETIQAFIAKEVAAAFGRAANPTAVQTLNT